MFDLASRAATGDSERIIPGSVAHEIDGAGHSGKPVFNNLAVSAGLPVDQFFYAVVVNGPAVAYIEMLDNSAIIERQVVAKIFFLGNSPTFLGCHFLGELHDDGFRIDDDAVKIENNGAQQMRISGIKIADGTGLYRTRRSTKHQGGV